MFIVYPTASNNTKKADKQSLDKQSVAKIII